MCCIPNFIDQIFLHGFLSTWYHTWRFWLASINSFHISTWQKKMSGWKSTQTESTIWPTWPILEAPKINFQRGNYRRSVSHWSTGYLVGVKMREQSWRWVALMPPCFSFIQSLSFSEIISERWIKISKIEKSFLDEQVD